MPRDLQLCTWFAVSNSDDPAMLLADGELEELSARGRAYGSAVLDTAGRADLTSGEARHLAYALALSLEKGQPEVGQPKYAGRFGTPAAAAQWSMPPERVRLYIRKLARIEAGTARFFRAGFLKDRKGNPRPTF